MKLAVKNRDGAGEFICLYDSYHGATLGTMGASWVSTMGSGKFIGGSRFNCITRQFIRVPNSYCYRRDHSGTAPGIRRIDHLSKGISAGCTQSVRTL